MMETEITVTRLNLIALIGWVGFFLGLLGGALQYLHPSLPGVWFLVVGLVGGGITITFSGPLRTKTTRRVQLRAVAPTNDDQR